MRSRKVKLIFLLLFNFIRSFSQDIHWSQMNQLQSFQNPSRAGEYSEDIKFTFAIKDQWRSVTKPYQTFLASVDTKLRKYDNFSLATNFLSDVVGDGSFRTNQLGVICSYDKKLNQRFNFSFGFDLGLVNKVLDFSNFKFDSQYDGYFFNNILSSNENYANTSFTNFNIGLGIFVVVKLNKMNKLSLGLSSYNLNKPKETFYQLQVNRPIRNNLNLNHILIFKRHTFNSSLYFVKQNTYHEFLIGFLDDFKTKSLKYGHIYSGVNYRFKDAFILNLGLSINKLRLIVSYDINISKLYVASRGRGSLELVIQYLLKKRKLTFPIKYQCIDYY
jgi:type IX secretion system PorP/SprF family membrane protein